MKTAANTEKTSPLKRELRILAPAYGVLIFFSFLMAVLALTSPLFAEQVLDRVVLSRSGSTLLSLAFIAFFLIFIYCTLEMLRKKALARLGIDLDRRLSRRVFDAVSRSQMRGRAAAFSAVQDFNTTRDFLSGSPVTTLMDAMWAPFFILIMALVHWVFVVLAIVVWMVSALLSVSNERLSREHSKEQQKSSQAANEFSMSVAQNSESVRALGMLPVLRERWYSYHNAMLGWRDVSQGRTHYIAGALLFIRNSQMVLLFSVGGFLYVQNEMALNGLIVLTIAMMRGINPIVGIVTNWQMYTGFAAAFRRLDDLLSDAEQQGTEFAVPALDGTLAVQRVFASAPGEDRIILNDISFALPQGRVLGVVGPNGAGKSCLARILVGIWRPRRGQVSIGDHDINHINQDFLGAHLGYLAQEVELLPGTIAENIARFDPSCSQNMHKVIAAAELAGIQDLIRSLPKGYGTRVGPGGHVLSGGQRHRIALARAVYDEPKLVVLDEPNANLDAQGEQALALMLQKLQAMDITVVVITHKLNLLSYCDDVLILNSGTVQAFGSRELIASRMPRLKAAPSLSVIQGTAEAQRN
ncbi:type I secretion system permease/ATPase [Terrihabitans sp. B22-R8]|uniref:type I secretion system permease/ATPase n=1 Tax=Terrihabitans sp. B22-R8 TaxID=3425128 RepID=UPI00403C7D8B